MTVNGLVYLFHSSFPPAPYTVQPLEKNISCLIYYHHLFEPFLPFVLGQVCGVSYEVGHNSFVFS